MVAARRAGFVAAAVALDQNGYELIASEADAAVMTLALAACEFDRGGLRRLAGEEFAENAVLILLASPGSFPPLITPSQTW